MSHRRCRLLAAAACLALFTAPEVARAKQNTSKDPKENPRPRIILRAQPLVAVAPARIVLTAELVGGANDFEEYYCPTVSWDWGDDTTSETTVDTSRMKRAAGSSAALPFSVFQREAARDLLFRETPQQGSRRGPGDSRGATAQFD
jgi:hypothetical protein